MSVRLRFHLGAERDLNEAAEYYVAIGPELARSLREEVEECIYRICKYPKAAPIVVGDVRRRIVHRFPYAVVYIADSSDLLIIAIAHLKRRPLYWNSRTQ